MTARLIPRAVHRLTHDLSLAAAKNGTLIG
jgi:hypothetical protein